MIFSVRQRPHKVVMNGNDTNGGASETNYAGKKIKKCKLIAQLVVPMEYDASFSIFA